MPSKKNTDVKRIVAICLGAIVVVFAVVLAGLAVVTQPAKLSEAKMQENTAAAEEAKAAYSMPETDTGEEDGTGGEGSSKELPAFEVAAGGAGAGATAAESNTKTDGEYLCSYSSERLMTEEDVDAINAEVYDGLPAGKSNIQMVINEMYAKHGYQFKNQEIQAYFNQKAWYQNISTRNADMDAIFQGMSDIEKKNVDFLGAYNGEEG